MLQNWLMPQRLLLPPPLSWQQDVHVNVNVNVVVVVVAGGKHLAQRTTAPTVAAAAVDSNDC